MLALLTIALGERMALKIQWSAHADQQLRTMRDHGGTWHIIATQLQIGRSAVIERARRLGIPPAPVSSSRPVPVPCRADRTCMPPGHPLTWAAITAGTILDGEPYPYPVFL